jgi:transketolase
MRPAIRLAALSNYPTIFIFTHDSIGLGEDGPTHQPVEHLAALRAIPNLSVFRPADAFEVKYAWQVALQQEKSPTAIILSRQNLPVLRDNDEALKGAYILVDTPKPDVLLMATGSEVALVLDAAKQLKEKGISARVVSMPCWELFEKQPAAYQDKILYQCSNRIAVEAGIKQGWEKYIGEKGKFIGMKNFGASAPAKKLFEHYKITVAEIVKAAQKVY